MTTYTTYQLANDADTYRPDAGKFIVTSADYEDEITGPMDRKDAEAFVALLNASQGILASFHESVKTEEAIAEFPALAAVAQAVTQATARLSPPPLPEPASGNAQRAAYAHELLSASEHHDATDPNGVRDVLSDLMHLCVKNEWNFTDLLRGATNNFNAELLDPECNGRAA